ncbi:MAG TPA: carboxypeptidase-like regulatory domain-containing protein [Candidatus Dormibacteraeota bacterium]|nr:carboxypeptidase-like regulatory domain-containing protein [Candidatus Dormibacteraeota bacterium]
MQIPEFYASDSSFPASDPCHGNFGGRAGGPDVCPDKPRNCGRYGDGPVGRGHLRTGAGVDLAHTATGVTRSTVTNEAGIYRFDAVDLGAYSLKISKPGFNVFLSTGFGVEANRTTTVDATLAVGDSETVVEVNADSAELLTRDAPLRGGNFHPQEVSQLPLTALNPISLARTLPCVSQADGNITFGVGENAGQSAAGLS